MKPRFLAMLLMLSLVLGLLASCGGDADEETIDEVEDTAVEVEEDLEETEIEETELEEDVTEEEVVEEEVVEEDVVEEEAAVEGAEITFWSTEEQPERAAITEDIIAMCEEQTGIGVELVLTNEDDLPSLMTSSVAAGTLPDVTFFPMDFVIGWADLGILDPEAATELINELGVETFAEGPLSFAEFDGGYAAVPSDGWGQLLIYRQDLFDEAGLERPDSYENILAAAEALNDPENNFYGITMANDPSAVFTQQTFEHIALANDCRLVDENGEIALDSPACVEAIDFYTNLLNNYSPAGIQDVETTRATYFAGQAAMIVWSPFILDEMAGLRDDAFPACPECEEDPAYLATASGIVPAFSGPSREEPAQYGQVSYMGITTGADTEAAQEFLTCFYNDGYLDWLSMAPEGKFPMRQGTPEEPQAFIEGWRNLETGVDRRLPLGEIYGEDVIDTLLEGAANFDRWGFGRGAGELVGPVYESLVVPQLLTDVQTGSLTPEAAASEMQAEIQDLVQ